MALNSNITEEKGFRRIYGDVNALPDLYIAAKLYVMSSRLLNTYLRMQDAHIDDLRTIDFYAQIALQRANVKPEELLSLHNSREDAYNKPFACKDFLNEADLAAFLVAKSFRMKNILYETGLWHKDSVIDFAVYFMLLKSKLSLGGLHV